MTDKAVEALVTAIDEAFEAHSDPSHIWGVAELAVQYLRTSGFEIVPGWQDIATAPKDGTPVLLFSRGTGLIMSASWEKTHWGDWRWFYYPNGDTVEDYPEARATDWRPRPAAPISPPKETPE